MTLNIPSRDQRAAVAAEIVEILARGACTGPSGRTVQTNRQFHHAANESRLFRPGELTKLAAGPLAKRGRARLSMVNETTLSAGRRLLEVRGPVWVMLLNFASARNPNGGFLFESQAKKGRFARASGALVADAGVLLASHAALLFPRLCCSGDAFVSTIPALRQAYWNVFFYQRESMQKFFQQP